MPLTRENFYADMAGLRGSAQFAFNGVPFDEVAQALASAMVAWIPTVRLMGVAVGTAGAGTINTLMSRIILPANPPVVIAGLISAGMQGPLSMALGTVVGQALAKTLSTHGGYAGVVTGVGVGTDMSRVMVADAMSLGTNLVSLLGAGPAASKMSLGLATGISRMFLTITGSGTVMGSPSVVSATGVSSSVVV